MVCFSARRAKEQLIIFHPASFDKFLPTLRKTKPLWLNGQSWGWMSANASFISSKIFFPPSQIKNLGWLFFDCSSQEWKISFFKDPENSPKKKFQRLKTFSKKILFQFWLLAKNLGSQIWRQNSVFWCLVFLLSIKLACP